MILSKKCLRAFNVALSCGAQVCLLLSVCLFLVIWFDPLPSNLTVTQNQMRYVEPLSRIELINRELLIEKQTHYDDQDFVSKTSEIAHTVFEIKPKIRHLDNESESYQFDVTRPSQDEKSNTKFLFVLHHYEQLGKATENLVQLCAIAKEMGRKVVQPFVKDSRMCGVPGGWSGKLRRKRRAFRPFDVYFDGHFFNQLMSKSGYADMTNIVHFKNSCAREKTTLIHFIYSDTGAENSLRKWYNLSSEQYAKVIDDIQKPGYCDCGFIDKGLDISNRIGGIHSGRELCIDPEKIRSIDIFENKVLRNDKCVVIVHWRGLGKNRTHFEPKVTIKPWELVTSLQHSSLIKGEVSRFKEVSFLDNHPYIAVHVRSERQLQWYGIDKLNRCLSVVIDIVEKLKKRHKVNQVFVSTDLSVYGSDTLILPSTQSTDLRGKLSEIHNNLLDKLKAISYAPPRSKKNTVLHDKGFVAITEMNLLFGGSHLVTLGSGSFQQWILDVFIKRHSKDNEQTWTVTRVCNREEKRSIKT